MFGYLKERMYDVANCVKNFYYKIEKDTERDFNSTRGPFPVQTGTIRDLADEYHAMMRTMRRKNLCDSKNSEDITDKF
jgi:hypothetical protein